jgi:L,D-transpeptidase catalytic domain
MRLRHTVNWAIAAASAVGFTALALGFVADASARGRYFDEDEPVFRGAQGAPLLAVVGLAEQRVTIYSAKGKLMDAPVSSGQTGLETPAGIFSIVQKEEDHHSNIYEDGSMPFMERITWTGIALHAGVLPGHPASHGCVRMPEAFAERLYGLTEIGMRVVIVREDIAPAAIAQPSLFTPSTRPAAETGPGSDPVYRLRVALRGKISDLEAAKGHEKEARQAAAKRGAEAAAAIRSQQAAEANLARAEAELKSAESAEAAAAEANRAQAAQAKEQALAKAQAARAQAEAAQREAQSKREAADSAGAEVKSAAAAAAIAADAAEEAELNLSPVSVFISRKTQRLYIRKNYKPVYETPVTIKDPDKPIGSFVFTALDNTGTPGEMRWNVVSLYKNPANAEPPAPEDKGKGKIRHGDPAAADTAGAGAALSRIVAPADAAARISEVVLPGSSLIVSDEGPSIETGKDTDFIVVMSGDPQGGLSIRNHQTASRNRDDPFGFFGRDSLFGRSSSSSYGRSSPRTGFPFFFGE